jgi:hypothetical protein
VVNRARTSTPAIATLNEMGGHLARRIAALVQSPGDRATAFPGLALYCETARGLLFDFGNAQRRRVPAGQETNQHQRF